MKEKIQTKKGRQPKKPRKKNDVLLKSVLEEIFVHLLRFFYANADDLFELDKGFVFLDKELKEIFPELNRKGGSRHVDMLVKVYLKNGGQEYILLHVELEGGRGKAFAKRMAEYFMRIYVKHGVDIAALVIFTGPKNQPRPSVYQKSYLETSITYEYKTFHVLDYTEEELLLMENPFSLIVLTVQKALMLDKIPEAELGMQRKRIAEALVASKKFDEEKIDHILYFLKTFVHIDNPRINRNFDTHVDGLLGRKNVMGVIETVKMLSTPASHWRQPADERHR